jgi:hypothetical protein
MMANTIKSNIVWLRKKCLRFSWAYCVSLVVQLLQVFKEKSIKIFLKTTEPENLKFTWKCSDKVQNQIWKVLKNAGKMGHNRENQFTLKKKIFTNFLKSYLCPEQFRFTRTFHDMMQNKIHHCPQRWCSWEEDFKRYFLPGIWTHLKVVYLSWPPGAMVLTT